MPNRLLAAVAFAALCAGCALTSGPTTPPITSTPIPLQTPAATQSPSTSPGIASPEPSAASPEPPSPSSSASPSGSPASAFYLRGSYTQSIPPKYTFTWLPPVTIADGTYINGNVAVPAIYPGPLMIVPVARSISDSGTSSIAAEAARLGLLGGTTDFTGGTPMPGAKVAQLDLEIDGKSYELTGRPDLTIQCIKAPCEGAPGSPEAYSAFWQDLLMLDSWMPDELGASAQYVPERVALLLTQSADPPTLSPRPTLVEWPLTTPIASSGVPYPGEDDTRCLTLIGPDLDTLWPILQPANQLTAFSDGQDVWLPTGRVLVPGEPSPCEA